MQDNIDFFLLCHSNKFKPEHIITLKDACKNIDTSSLYGVSLRNPMTMFIISWFLGTYGVDRFMLKDIKAGVAKVTVFVLFMIFYFIFIFSAVIASEHNYYISDGLVFVMIMSLLTGIMVFVFWLYDLCTVIRRTKEYNFMKMCEILNLTNVNTSVSQSNPTITTVSKTFSETVSDKNIADNE